MAASFDVYLRWTFMCVLISQVLISHGKRHKHPPVVAFFQGHCGQNFCDQKCLDIDNGGFACECYDGYQLNRNGFTCSKKDDNNKNSVANIESPEWIKIVSVDDIDFSNKDPVRIDNDGEHITFDSDVLHGDRNKLIDNSKDEGDANIAVQEDLTSTSSVPIGGDKVVISDKTESLKPVKIETFDHTVEAPDLEPVSLRHSVSELKSQKNENLQNLVPNPVPKARIIDPLDVKGNHGEILVREKCDEFSCLNQGKCVDDGTVYRNKLRCDCLLGSTGLKCEKELEVRYPKFLGNSFLALPMLNTGYKHLDILLEFKPTAKYGLLFFTAEFEDARSDFFSVALIDGYIEFRYDCGTGMGILRSGVPARIGEWNMLKIVREDSNATLWLNDAGPIQGSSPGLYSRLTLRLNLYLGGYDNMTAVADKVGTNKGFVGCVEQLVVNGYKYDMRKAGVVGDAQFGVNVGECSEGVCDNVVCQFGGICKVTSADSHVCLCPIGRGGENCQHEISVHIPEFGGHSYIEYDGLGRSSLLFLEIELVIKPTKPNGVILYNGYTKDRQGDFISLAMVHGHLEFRFDLGTGPAVLRSLEAIILNHWHWVKISRTGLEGILEIDYKVAAIGQSQGAFTQLTLTQSLFIGGHRNFDETSKLANISESFDGCIQKIIINNHPLKLIEDAKYGVNIESCAHPCVGQPCLNNGQCVPKKDIYTCYCPLGYASTNCELKLESGIDNPRFSGESFLMYTQKEIYKRIGGDKIDIRFFMKPVSPNGLLFWSGPDEMLPSSDYIALGFVNGALQFRYNLGSGEAIISYNNSRLFDGKWHYIHAQRYKQDGFLAVDEQEVIEGTAKGTYTMLNTNKILYIGGMPDVSQRTLKKFTSGYNGCLQDLTLAEDYRLQMVQSAQNGQNVLRCS